MVKKKTGRPVRDGRKPKPLMKGHASLYIPREELGWYNQLNQYVYSKGLNMSFLIRSLLKAFEANELRDGRKKK